MEKNPRSAKGADRGYPGRAGHGRHHGTWGHNKVTFRDQRNGAVILRNERFSASDEESSSEGMVARQFGQSEILRCAQNDSLGGWRQRQERAILGAGEG